MIKTLSAVHSATFPASFNMKRFIRASQIRFNSRHHIVQIIEGFAAGLSAAGLLRRVAHVTIVNPFDKILVIKGDRRCNDNHARVFTLRWIQNPGCNPSCDQERM